jgi:hypothetical protein
MVTARGFCRVCSFGVRGRTPTTRTMRPRRTQPCNRKAALTVQGGLPGPSANQARRSCDNCASLAEVTASLSAPCFTCPASLVGKVSTGGAVGSGAVVGPGSVCTAVLFQPSPSRSRQCHQERLGPARRRVLRREPFATFPIPHQPHRLKVRATSPDDMRRRYARASLSPAQTGHPDKAAHRAIPASTRGLPRPPRGGPAAPRPLP